MSMICRVSYIRTSVTPGRFCLQTILFGNRFLIFYLKQVFTIKHGLTIIFASFNRTVNFDGTPINTIEKLRLSIKIHTFRPLSPHGQLVQTVSLPTSLSNITNIAGQAGLVTSHCTWLGYLYALHLSSDTTL